MKINVHTVYVSGLYKGETALSAVSTEAKETTDDLKH
jgi:hypothetical protein